MYITIIYLSLEVACLYKVIFVQFCYLQRDSLLEFLE